MVVFLSSLLFFRCNFWIFGLFLEFESKGHPESTMTDKAVRQMLENFEQGA